MEAQANGVNNIKFEVDKQVQMNEVNGTKFGYEVDKQVFNSKALAIFKKKVFSGVYYKYNMSSDEKLLKCKVPLKNQKHFPNKNGGFKTDIIIKGYELKDTRIKKTYLLPSEISVNGKMVHISKQMPIKVKGSYEIYHNKKVYHYVPPKFVASVNYPEDNTLSMKDFIDKWFDIEHTNPNDALVARFALLSSHIGGFTRIVGDKGFGKDGWANTLINVSGMGNNISKVSSDAKFFQLIEDKYTVFNEISGFGGERKENIQNFMLGTGDVNTPEYNHSTTGNEKTGTKTSIVDYAWSVIHNPPEYYMNNGQLTFEQMFQPAIFDRLLVLKVEGRVLAKNSFQQPNLDFEKIVEDNLPFYKLFVGKLIWIRNNVWKIPLKYSIDKYDIKTNLGDGEASSRWWNTLTRIAQLVQEYANCFDNKEEKFYEVMDMVYDSHKRGIKEIEDLGIMG